MTNNVCISKDFDTPSAIARLSEVVNDKCGFEESKTGTTPGRNSEENIDIIIENATLKTKLEVAHTKEKTFAATVQRLNEQMNTLKLQHENQIAMIREAYGELESKWNATCNARTTDLSDIIEKKLREIDDLLDDQMKLQEEVRMKTHKIGFLENKLEDLRCD